MLFPELIVRQTLEQDWLTLTRKTLPQIALSRGWPIQNDHCFQRVLLDNACNGKWADVILVKPAYRNAPEPILSAALALGMAVFCGTEDLSALNDRSLKWRGKQHLSNQV